MESGRVPWTIVRATQFHELLAATLTTSGRWRVLPVPRARLQTVAAVEVARARRRVERGRPHSPVPYPEQRELVTAFTAACQEGDPERLVTLLDPDVVWRGDGGGKVTAVRRVVREPRRWRGLLAYGLDDHPPRLLRVATVIAAPGLVLCDADGTLSIVAFTVDAGRITAVSLAE